MSKSPRANTGSMSQEKAEKKATQVLSDEMLRGLVQRLDQLKAMSSEPGNVQKSIDEVHLALRLRTVTGRATHVIDKKFIQGQRVISAFGGVKTSQARAQGLAKIARPDMSKAAVAKKAYKAKAAEKSAWSTRGESPTDRQNDRGVVIEEDDGSVIAGKAMQEHWCINPTDEQYAASRQLQAGATGWQGKFEAGWMAEQDGMVELARENRGKAATKRARALAMPTGKLGGASPSLAPATS